MDEVKNNIISEIEKLKSSIEENKELLNTTDEPEMKSLAQEEINRLESQINSLEESLNALDGNFESDEESVEEDGVSINPNTAIMEIRAGTGGDEAGIFANDLFRMYSRYADTNGIKVIEVARSDNEAGGIKTISAEFIGKNIYNLLKNESGVHRVQRVPVTESSGRIHTSAATVAVLPKIKKINFEINPEDLEWSFYRSGGKGGQNVNKVSTAVRLIHTPTQIMVECQEARTQGKNREKALQMLESRIYNEMKEQQVKNITELRSSQVGSGDRSEKIRTYNFPQDRVTDHRLGKNWGNISGIMDGNLDKIFLALQDL